MPEEKSLAIIGDEDIISGFSALGFKIYAVKTQQEFKSALDEVVHQNKIVCLVQENIYQAARDQITNYQNLPLPVFVPFSKDSKTDFLGKIVRDIRLRATGTF
jgi:vacuolar-type H+-ATPase subunit F/Vma7